MKDGSKPDGTVKAGATLRRMSISPHPRTITRTRPIFIPTAAYAAKLPFGLSAHGLITSANAENHKTRLSA
jgi:hypothetical protein